MLGHTAPRAAAWPFAGPALVVALIVLVALAAVLLVAAATPLELGPTRWIPEVVRA